jgi:hypothetical protein
MAWTFLQEAIIATAIALCMAVTVISIVVLMGAI